MTIFRGNVRAKGKRSAVTAFDQVKLSSSENHELCATWIGLTRKIIIINLLALSLSPPWFGSDRNENWLFSRYSTGWKCGLHADWTELTGCVDQELDKNEGETAKRRYFYITLLRSPIPRYLSEFRHVQRGATWKSARHFCLGRSATAEELPSCYTGEFIGLLGPQRKPVHRENTHTPPRVHSNETEISISFCAQAKIGLTCRSTILPTVKAISRPTDRHEC